jgi:hypothetical protein
MAYTSSQVVQAVPTGINSALVLITSGAISDTTSVDNCFTSTYLNYKLVFNNLVSGDANDVRVRLRASGSDDTNSLYTFANFGQSTSSGGEQNLGVGRDIGYFALGYSNNFTNGQSLSIDLFSPQTAKNTHYGPGVFWNGEVTNAGFIAGIHKSTSIFDGFTIYPQSSTLSGSYKVYGYTNS